MIGFELWQTAGISLRKGFGVWIDQVVGAALETTDRAPWTAGIRAARMPEGVTRDVPYAPKEWGRQKAKFAQGRLRELGMGLSGRGWHLEVTAHLHGAAPSQPLVTQVGLFLHRDARKTLEEPLLDRVDLLEEGARLGVTGGRIGPSDGALTWWENLTGRHHYDFWLVADRCVRGPDFALLLGPGHIQLLGGLEKILRDCPCERIAPVEGTDLVLIQLVEKVVIDEGLEGKASRLEQYLSPLLDW